MSHAMKGAVLLVATLAMLSGCAPPMCIMFGGSARDPEGLEAQRAAARAIERAEEAGASLETPDQYGITPLYHAAGTGGSYKAIQRLLAAGANIEGRSFDEGHTALCAACSAGINHAHGSIQPPFEVYERVRVLLEAGADPNARNSRGETVLMTMTSSYGGDCERAAMLLEHGARVDAKDNAGKTPLMHHVRRGDIAEVILAVPQDLEARDATGRTALSWAAVQSSDFEGSTLHQLLGRGAQVESVDDNGRTPLMHAFEDGHAQNVITLLLHGARADRGGWTPLMITSFDAYYFAVRSLIEKGAAVNDTDFAGRTALHWAAKGWAHPDVYRLLINGGADVNAADHDGWTPLHVAARRASPQHVQVLLDAGANPDARDAMGRTPLMRAIEDYFPLYNTKLLAERGANLDAQDDEGVTALMMASVKDDRTMEYLITMGARLDIRDRRGRTAADHAKERYPEATRFRQLLTPKPKADSPRE